MRVTIYLKVLLLVGIVLVLVTAAVTAVDSLQGRARLAAELEIRTEQAAKELATAVLVPFWDLNRDAVQQVLAALGSDPDFLAARVTTTDGDIFAEIGETDRGRTQYFAAQAPIVIEQGGALREVGAVTVRLSQERMLGVQTDLLRQAILTGIVQLFAVLAITALALRAIIRPLSNITDRLVRLANGRVDEQVPELQRSDVIGDMARAVDTFRESIIELGKLREEDLLKAENLEKARDDAEAASQAKSQFLAAMSHELRTPLNGILGFAQLLVLDADEDLNAEQRQAVDHILSSGNLLLELIDQVLDLEKIEAKESQISMSEVPIAGMVGECLPAIERIASRQGIGLEIASAPADLRVSADPLCLKQILLNLLSNAVKYNRQGGRVALSYDDGADGRLRVAVSDTGYGIAADDLEAIFEPFNRLDASHSGIEGTGIGLTITKRLIEQMHGRIGVDTTPGQGSTFWVELERVA